MQKFVVCGNNKKLPGPLIVDTSVVNAGPAITFPTAQIKMTGYLKKKRNRVGGWRKLWFVLQNQLLLSYSSREDYEKKLAPFKDVLNLVPGTIIRPAPGARFTIETTSNAIYTFRCDDNKNCSQWITAVVDSLTMGGPMGSVNNKSHNLNSFCRPLIKGGKMARIPITKDTARILKRGHYESELNDSVDSRVQQDFRLHRTEGIVNQSHDVSRINSMFASRNGVTILTAEVNPSRNCPNELRWHERNIQSTDVNQNKLEMFNDECEIEEQMQCISLEDKSGSDLDIDATTTAMNEDHKILNGVSMATATADIPNDEEDHEGNIKTSLNNYCSNSSNSSNSSSNGGGEPIYAVVDLKDKYARRAKLKEEAEETMNRERPKSVQVLSNDYEEVQNLSSSSSFHIYEDSTDSEENIYEPINIPELSRKHPMWRYFPKINLDTLVEITKWKKDPKIGECSVDSIAASSSTTAATTTTTTATSFSEMRRKWGNHRKSIKNRMKKIYTTKVSDTLKPDQEVSKSCELPIKESPNANHHHQLISGFNLIKRDRNLFGSLSRLRKSRTSACLEDIMPNKKKFFAPTANDGNKEFQLELRKEINKRCGGGDEKIMCQSTFYD